MSECLMSPRPGSASLTRRERSGEHVLEPGVGWLLKG